MQSAHIMAFRKRLKKRGYTYISICKSKDNIGLYIVTAVEPLAQITVSRELSIIGMYNMFRF